MRHPSLISMAALALALPAEEAATEPPNIVVLFADDQRTDTIGAWGNPTIETPNIDRMADAGFSFRRTYCLGSPHGAVCQPSRAMLHTGSAYHGMNLSTFDERPTLGGLLREAGYDTFATGKWHNGRGTLSRSFARGRSILLGGMSDHHQVPIVDFDGEEYTEARTGAKHSSELFADAAVEFLTSHESEAPFFLYVAFTAPHDPRDPPPDQREAYFENKPELPANFKAQHVLDNGFLTVRDEVLAGWPRTESVVRDQLAEYYALITHLDAQVGRILDALEESGHGDDTILVYAADHGLAVGSHGLLGKQSLYEHSMRAPMIVKGPGIPVGATGRLTYLHDLFPTLLEFGGVEAPESDSAENLRPLWDGTPYTPRTDVFTSMGNTQRAVTERRWKLIRYPKIDRTQLFDLGNDPDELFDLSEDPEHVETVERLRERLEAWQAQVGDDLPWTADELVPAEVDLTGRPRTPDHWQPEWIRDKYFGDESE